MNNDTVRIKHEDTFLVLHLKNYNPEIHELYESAEDVKEEETPKPKKKKKAIDD